MAPSKKAAAKSDAEATAEIVQADGVGNPGAVLTGDAQHGEPELKATEDGGVELGTHDSPPGVDHKLKVYDPAKGEVAPDEELPQADGPNGRAADTDA